jgi:hypothetical protein
MHLTLTVSFFRIRRFRKGFPFIFKSYTIIAALFFTGIMLIYIAWFNISTASEEAFSGTLYFVGILITGLSIFMLIRRLIKRFQNKLAQQNGAVHYEKLWQTEKDEKEQAQAIIKDQSAIIHNFADRIAALEAMVVTESDGKLSAEVAQLKKDLQEKMTKRQGRPTLPATNNRMLDQLFAHFAAKFLDDGIDFVLMVNGSIAYLVEHVIRQGELETLIVNLLNNAQIAVNLSNNSFRRVTAALGLAEDFYEFTVYDSGIPFAVDTLVRLGTGRVTTHADKSGSGIGFETIFATIRDCQASLLISEQEPSKTDYSKAVAVRFDGKNKYIIETYRPCEFGVSERYLIVHKY